MARGSSLATWVQEARSHHVLPPVTSATPEGFALHARFPRGLCPRGHDLPERATIWRGATIPRPRVHDPAAAVADAGAQAV